MSNSSGDATVRAKASSIVANVEACKTAAAIYYNDHWDETGIKDVAADEFLNNDSTYIPCINRSKYDDKLNGRRLTLREIQLAELDLLIKTTDFFDKHNINYILCGGTLLGAVRHGGFIPWDDDIDVLVPRDDFERFRKMAAEDRNIISGAELQIPGDEHYVYPFIKICDPEVDVDCSKANNPYVDNKLWVDVFPLDHYPDNGFLHWVYLWLVLAQKKSLAASTFSDEYAKIKGYAGNFNLFKKLLFIGAKIFYRCLGGYKSIAKNLDSIARHMDRKYKHSQHVGDASWPNGMNDYFHVSWCFPTMKMKFEGHDFNVPVNYDSYLTRFYGDYMTLPPENKRQIHYLTAYRMDE